MTSAFFSRRAALLGAVSLSLLISACNSGKNDTGPSYMRALNLSSDIASVDVWVDSANPFPAQVTDALSGYASFDSNTYTLSVRKAGDAAALFTNSYALSKDKHYTAVVWGRETSLHLSTLPEDEDTTAIAAGNTRVRIFNATVDTGTLDVFFTTSTANLGDTAVTQGALTSGTLSGFREISAGSYRLRVTGASNPNDVRLDIPVVTLAAGTYNSLVITAGAGGVLVNGSLLVQQDKATAFRSHKARVRLAAGVADSASVSATVGGSTISGAVASPRVGGYVLIDSGTADVNVRVNGGAPVTSSQSFADGGDYTVMAYGDSAAPVVTTLVDDNRLPSTSTRAKLRLVNGVYDAGPLTLSLDYQPLQPSDIAVGLASDYYSADASTAARIEVSSLSATAPLFTQVPASTADKLLLGQGVYTVFMFGRAADKAGVFRRDR